MDAEKPRPVKEKTKKPSGPRRWRAAKITIGKDTFLIHPDKKVYQQKRGNTLWRVKDRELARSVYERWLKREQDAEENNRLANQRAAARLKAMTEASSAPEPEEPEDGQ